MSAGARLTVMRLAGKARPEALSAARTRSRDSPTALSARPTTMKAMAPGAICTWTSTGRASMPSKATVDTRATMPPLACSCRLAAGWRTFAERGRECKRRGEDNLDAKFCRRDSHADLVPPLVDLPEASRTSPSGAGVGTPLVPTLAEGRRAQPGSRKARSNPQPRASSRSERAWRGLRALDLDPGEHGGIWTFSFSHPVLMGGAQSGPSVAHDKDRRDECASFTSCRVPPCSPASSCAPRNPRHARRADARLRVAPGCSGAPLTPAARAGLLEVSGRGACPRSAGKFDSPPAGRTRGRPIASQSLAFFAIAD